MCIRDRVGRGSRWSEPDADELRALPEPSGAIRVIYGVCEPCLRMLPDGRSTPPTDLKRL